MKILIADKLSEQAVSSLKKLGADVTMNPDLSADDLASNLDGVEILIVRSTKVKADAIAAGKSLSLIIRAGAGVNTIDLETAGKRGIYVANTPGKNTDAVAELAIGHLIAADRRIVSATKDLGNGKWRKKEYGKAGGLKGRTLGIIGLGSIGKAVAKRAAGLDMNVIAWSRSLTPELAEELEIAYCKSAKEVAEKADAISLHLASTPDTKHMVNAEFLSSMKDGAILVNAARGEVVDTAALKKAIKEKSLKVGLDVFENEPSSGEAAFEDKELAELAACTPHIGASTDQASEAIASEVVNVVKSYLETGKPIHAVNIREKSPAKISLVARHFNKVGVLASVLTVIREEGINIEEMANTIFKDGEAASCTLKLDTKPSAAALKKLEAIENIIEVSLK
jgi:D-3-phosphoglycerate dehydrogenase